MERTISSPFFRSHGPTFLLRLSHIDTSSTSDLSWKCLERPSKTRLLTILDWHKVDSWDESDASLWHVFEVGLSGDYVKTSTRLFGSCLKVTRTSNFLFLRVHSFFVRKTSNVWPPSFLSSLLPHLMSLCRSFSFRSTLDSVPFGPLIGRHLLGTTRPYGPNRIGMLEVLEVKIQ